MSEKAAEAWERAWPDERVPALGGLTPRQATGRESHRPLLEALLRDFEYRADQHRSIGRAAPNIDRLRAELGMSAREVRAQRSMS